MVAVSRISDSLLLHVCHTSVPASYEQIWPQQRTSSKRVGTPAASVYAVCEGISQVDVKANANFGIMQDLMDARSARHSHHPST
jgi:hypothetical protein